MSITRRLSFPSIAVVMAMAALMAVPARASGIPVDRQSAVILIYHSIGDDPDSSDISPDQFRADLRELKSGGYNVVSLPKLVEALKKGDALPEHSVAITFDDGDKSIATVAAPLLLQNGLPFTVFIAPDQIDGDSADSISWRDIDTLRKSDLVSFGLDPQRNGRLTGQTDTEVLRRIHTAKASFREKFGDDPELFAYPFGLYSLAIRNMVEANGFTAAFGQQSSVAFAGSDLYALPRFSMTAAYGDLDRFRMIVNALPLPITNMNPPEPFVKTDRPAIGFSVDPALKKQLSSLHCFATDQPPPTLRVIGDTRVELRLKQPVDDDKLRVSCTMAAPDYGDAPARWRWFGTLLALGG